MLASPADILRDYPALVENAKKAGREEQAKSLTAQIEWAKGVTVEEIPAPVVTYDSELRVHVNGETVQIWHTPPAHTDGDSAVYFEKANVLHLGDLFFNQVIPFIDVRSGGSPAGYLKALDAVIARVPADVTIIPGHGEVTDVAGLRRFREYVAGLIEMARMARAAGQSRDDFVKTDVAAYASTAATPTASRTTSARRTTNPGAEAMRVLVGSSGYSYKEWKGTFYPEDLPATEMLRYYAERFATVEINNTFYRMPTADVLAKWACETPKASLRAEAPNA